jgi:hypothetical protein
MVSKALTWEKVYSTNVGIDIGMFENRLNLSYDYFIRTTNDMVGPPKEVGDVLGVGLPNTNNAMLNNCGWELEARWQDRIRQVNYNVSFNLSDNRVKVLSYPNPSGSLATYYEGQILGDIYGYETEGIAKTDEEMQAWLINNDQSKLGSQWGAGDIMYRDLDGDKIVDSGANTLKEHGDRRIIGNSNPRFRFGMNLGAQWKELDISLFLQGVMKRDIWLSGPLFWGADGGLWQSVGFEEHIDFFRPANTNSYFGSNTDSYYPKAYIDAQGNKNKNVQTRYLQNAAYMRLKNVQLGYQIPAHLCRKVNLERIRIYVSAENLFTISQISNIFDPEAFSGEYSSGKTYPLSSTLSFGINVNL